MVDMVLCEARELYNKVKTIYKNTGYDSFYELNSGWAGDNMKVMLDVINSNVSAHEAIHSIQKTWLFSINTSDPVKEKAVDWLLANQRRNGCDIFAMDTFIEESPFSNPENNVSRNGRILTPDFLRTVSIAMEIKKYCSIPASRFRVIELGAGCGHLARTLRLVFHKCSHLIIDIPETLCFSYMFLKLNFPEAKMLYVTESQQLEDVSTEAYDYIFIPTMYAERILENPFDLFVNTASMGEMKNSVIRYWMDFIQNRLKVKYIFTLNRFLNTILTDGSYDVRLDENECSVLYDSDWKILNWELAPSYTRCPYVDAVIARYVEIVAERTRVFSPESKRQRSLQLLSYVRDEDWVRLEHLHPRTMVCMDNILANDLSMNGTLFKIWESIRLYPDEENVAIMLKYLETIIYHSSKEFEETFYYENLFMNLFTSKDKNDLLKVVDTINAKSQYRKSFRSSPPSYSEEVIWSSPYLYRGYKNITVYKDFNIIPYKGRFYAMPQSLEYIGLDEEDTIRRYQEKEICIVGETLEGTRYLVAKTYDALKSENDALKRYLDVIKASKLWRWTWFLRGEFFEGLQKRLFR